MGASVLQDFHMILQPRSGSKEERRVSAAVAKVDRGALLEKVAQDFHVGPGGREVLLSSSALHAETQSCITRQIVSPHRRHRVKDKSPPRMARMARQLAAASCVPLPALPCALVLILILAPAPLAVLFGNHLRITRASNPQTLDLEVPARAHAGAVPDHQVSEGRS